MNCGGPSLHQAQPAQAQQLRVNWRRVGCLRARTTMTVDVSDKPQIVEHVVKNLTQTVYETRWIPCSARFIVLGSPPRQSGMLQVYSLTRGDVELLGEAERPKAFKCGTFGA